MKPPKISPELLDLIERSRSEPEVSCECANPDAAYQQIWRYLRYEAATVPLLFAGRPGGYPKISAKPAERMVVLRWPEVQTPKQPQPKTVKMPKWLEAKLEDFKTTRELAAANPEYRLAWMDLDTLVIACERLAEVLAADGEDADLEKFVRTANSDYLDMAFRGAVAEFSHLETIEVLRQAIADIPVDDPSREQERLDLIKRRERLMLERDKRLEGTDPLI